MPLPLGWIIVTVIAGAIIGAIDED